MNNEIRARNAFLLNTLVYLTKLTLWCYHSFEIVAFTTTVYHLLGSMAEGMAESPIYMFIISLSLHHSKRVWMRPNKVATSAPGLIFSRFFENLTIALKKYFSSSDFGSPDLLTSLYEPWFPLTPFSGPFCLRERAPWSRGCKININVLLFYKSVKTRKPYFKKCSEATLERSFWSSTLMMPFSTLDHETP